MSTNIEKVYNRFLNKISDYKYSLTFSSKEEIESSLLDLYLSASTHFIQCRKDLSTNYDSVESLPLDEYIFINGDLNGREIEILTKLMLVECMRPIIIRNETLEQALSDVDFVIYSQANHINQLQSLFENLKREANSDMVEYSYLETGAYDN